METYTIKVIGIHPENGDEFLPDITLTSLSDRWRQLAQYYNNLGLRVEVYNPNGTLRLCLLSKSEQEALDIQDAINAGLFCLLEDRPPAECCGGPGRGCLLDLDDLPTGDIYAI